MDVFDQIFVGLLIVYVFVLHMMLLIIPKDKHARELYVVGIVFAVLIIINHSGVI
jgi:mannose/fructose/N-acetylgalactosamine-specific phosphotransferase system component IID